MSRGAKKLDNRFKRPAPPNPGTATPAKRRPFGSLEKAVEATHRPVNTTRDRCLSPVVVHATSINSAISSTPSDTDIDPKGKSAPQTPATSRSSLLSQPRAAHALSTQASVTRSLGPRTGAINSGFSSVVHRRAATSSRRQASPVSPFTRKKQHLFNSMSHSADLLYTQLPHEISDRASATFASPLDPTSMHANQRPAVEATRTHCIVKNQSGSLKDVDWGAHMYSIFLFCAKLIVFLQLLYRIQYPQLGQPQPSLLPVLCPTYPLSVSPTNFLFRSRSPAKHFPRIFPHPSSLTLLVLRLHVHGNPYMITPP